MVVVQVVRDGAWAVVGARAPQPVQALVAVHASLLLHILQGRLKCFHDTQLLIERTNHITCHFSGVSSIHEIVGLP